MKATLGAVLLVTGIAGGAAATHILEKPKMPRVVEIDQPLLLAGGSSANSLSLLPKGTALYYDQAMPEGFVRYKVYVNVEGIKLESKEVGDSYGINPLTAFPADKDQLQMLLHDYPLTKDDLASILKSGKISREDIRALLAEYSK